MHKSILIALIPLAASAVQFNETYVDFAAKATTEPVLDGRLDEPCWAAAPVHTRFYEYYKPNPKLAPIRSEMRVLYTEKALWIGIVHYEDHPEKLRVIATTRDAVDWNEDMDEVYIDPAGDAIGFFRFNINSAGVMGDVRRIDASVMQNEWNGDSWNVKTTVGADRWTVEMCVPFTDLQAKPEPGKSVWRLCVTRYQWTSGKFVGSVSSPKGAYTSPGNFGYLCFLAEGEKGDSAYIRDHLKGRIAPPWGAFADGSFLIDDGSRMRSVTEAELAAEAEAEKAEAAAWKARLEAEFGGAKGGAK